MANNVYDTNLVATIINYMLAFANHTTQPGDLRLGSHFLLSADGKFSFDITGSSNVTFAIERSTNQMVTWQAIATNQLSSGAALFTNTVSTVSHFYRARIISPH